MVLYLIGSPLNISNRGFTRPSASYVSYYLEIDGLELNSMYFKKYTHSMAMGYF